MPLSLNQNERRKPGFSQSEYCSELSISRYYRQLQYSVCDTAHLNMLFSVPDLMVAPYNFNFGDKRVVQIQESHGSTTKPTQHCGRKQRGYVWKEGKVKQITKLYAGKFLLSYNAQEICYQRHIQRAERRVASRGSSSVGPQGHRKTIPKMQECRGCIFLNPESSANDNNRLGKVKLCPPLASANVFPQEAFFAQTEMSI